MNWKEQIVVDPSVLAGKPVIKGTRLSVEFLMGLLANGWSIEQILENYPQITRHHMQAIFSFTQSCLADEEFVMFKKAS
jgi:uncharacterized protein (DUF433 family)